MASCIIAIGLSDGGNFESVFPMISLEDDWSGILVEEKLVEKGLKTNSATKTGRETTMEIAEHHHRLDVQYQYHSNRPFLTQ